MASTGFSEARKSLGFIPAPAPRHEHGTLPHSSIFWSNTQRMTFPLMTWPIQLTLSQATGLEKGMNLLKTRCAPAGVIALPI